MGFRGHRVFWARVIHVNIGCNIDITSPKLIPKFGHLYIMYLYRPSIGVEQFKISAYYSSPQPRSSREADCAGKIGHHHLRAYNFKGMTI